ncbi:MAG TPA: sulfite exporter TauE/SafE family protein [Pyrinomonadaceae bacterium]|nr:sulfite exporter TauE/SafE family protein [Pyrinomonadaceae bacterium]
MNATEVATLSILILLAATLYSSVGHGGASGYLAAMSLFGLAPAAMKPTALCLNILVASIATLRFWRAGCFSWALLWPFAVASVPLAFLGGAITLPTAVYKQIVGVTLLYAAFRLFMFTRAKADGDAVAAAAATTRNAPLPQAIFLGALIGLLSGLTGVGGGIFLSPLLLLAGWADTRRTAGVSAAFILVNSIAGLLGNLTNVPQALPRPIPYFAFAAVVGGLFGSEFGSRRLASVTIRRLLAVVLVVAGMKMIFV